MKQNLGDDGLRLYVTDNFRSTILEADCYLSVAVKSVNLAKGFFLLCFYEVLLLI